MVADPLPRWAVAAAAVLPAALAVLTARGTRPVVGPDAVSYVAVADSIRAGEGLGFWLERPLTTWPPLWPATLAAGGTLTGWRGDLVALAVNAVLLVGVVLVGAALARRVLERRWVRVAQLAGLAVSPALVGLAVIVQTEVAFVLGAAAALLLVLVGIERDQRWWFAAAGIVLAVSFYVRYQAFYAVPVLAGWLGLRTWLTHRSLRRAAADLSWLVVPAVAPSVVWMVRNLRVSDTVMGPRFPSDIGPVANTAGAFRTLAKFLFSIPTGPAVPLTLLGVAAAAAMAAGVVAAARADDPRRSWSAALNEAVRGPVGLLVTFVVGFNALMVVSRSVVGFDDLDIRLLAPCLVPTALVFLRWVEVVLLGRRGWDALGRAAVAVWLAAQVAVTALLVGPANASLTDAGYNAPRAVAAAHSPAIDQLPEGCVLYSNNAGDLYRSGLRARVSPRKVEYKSDQPTDDLDELVRAVAGGQRTCLAWVEYTEDDEVYSRKELSRVLDLREVASADGVTVYVVGPAS